MLKYFSVFRYLKILQLQRFSPDYLEPIRPMKTSRLNLATNKCSMLQKKKVFLDINPSLHYTPVIPACICVYLYYLHMYTCNTCIYLCVPAYTYLHIPMCTYIYLHSPVYTCIFVILSLLMCFV